MQLIDLSHLLSADTKPYPGSTPPQIRQMALIEKNGYREKMLGLSSHLGTHVDAPAHMLASGKTLEQFSLEKFFGRAFVVNAQKYSPGEIPLAALEEVPPDAGPDFILFHTGWSKHWDSPAYFSGYPSISTALAAKLSEMKIKGVGLDGPSADAPNSENYEAHHLLLGAEVLIIENLCNLEKVINKTFTLSVFPLKIEDADGTPVRAVALMDGAEG